MADSTSELIARIERCETQLTRLAFRQGEMGLLSTDLTAQQIRVLIILFAGGDLSAHELAKAIGVGATTMTGIVDRLESRDLVLRKPDPNDRRVRLIALSTTGKRLVRETQEQGRRHKRRLLKRLDPRVLANFAEAIEALAVLADEEWECGHVDGRGRSGSRTTG